MKLIDRLKNLVPWKARDAEGERVPVRQGGLGAERPFDDLLERFLGDPFGDDLLSGGRSIPGIAVHDGRDGVTVEAEVPGVDPADLDVSVDDGRIVISGERHADREERDGDRFLTERGYGSFYTATPLPPGLDTARARADYRKGTLTVHVPRRRITPRLKRRTIPIS
jgi:HSP20 family protein